MHSKKNILVAPMNWGLGHSTRCIPIIKKLLERGFNPILASDGEALLLLQKEFPKLKSIELPSYQIKYPQNGKRIKWRLLLCVPEVIRTVRLESRMTQNIVEDENLIGIISDNRFGVRSKNIPCVIISHHLNVLSGITTFFTSKVHQHILKKFDECWIPDNNQNRLSGKLSDAFEVKNSKFIGVLSRFSIFQIPTKYDLMVLLSGVEPQRSLLEQKLLSELSRFKGKVLLVRGKVEKEHKIKTKGDITICNFLLSEELEKALNESKLVLCRSGYSSIMDLSVLNKKAFFIPTSGQNEQEYLAKYMEEVRIAPFSTERDFKIEMLNKTKNYSGFRNKKNELAKDLFDLFQSE